MRVLVTGGRGFLGSYVCEALAAAGHEPTALGRADGDLAEPGTIERLLDQHEAEAVVHLAAVMPDDDRLAQNVRITELVRARMRGARLSGSCTGRRRRCTRTRRRYADSKRASEVAAGDATLCASPSRTVLASVAVRSRRCCGRRSTGSRSSSTEAGGARSASQPTRRAPSCCCSTRMRPVRTTSAVTTIRARCSRSRGWRAVSPVLRQS